MPSSIISPTISLLLYLSILFTLTTSLGCYHQQPSSIPPSATDCEAAIDLIPPGLVFDPSQPGSPEQLNLSIPATHLRSYKLPSFFIKGSCSIQVRFHDFPQHPGFPASELYFSFWPNVRALAKQIMRRCVDQPPNRIWGGFTISYHDEPGVMAYSYNVMVGGWNYNIYTPFGKLLH